MINRVIRNFQIKKYLGSSFSKVGEVAGSLIKKVVQKYKEIDRIIKEIDRIEEVKAEINTSLTANGNANAKDVCGKTLVHRAAWIGDTEKLRVCKRAGIDIDIEAKAAFDDTPLHCAAYRGRTETFKYLIEEAGADVEAETTGGDKVIHIAIFPENIEMVECLKKAKADLNAINGSGQTPLHKAISFQCTKMVECLIKVRANINATDSKGRTPRDLVNDLESQDRDMEKIKDLLIEAGAKTGRALRKEARAEEVTQFIKKELDLIKVKNNLGRTHLGLLIDLENSGRNMEKIKDLLKKTDLNAIDKDGRTCLDLVNCLESMGDKVDKWIKDLLIEAGAKTGKQLDEEEKKQNIPQKLKNRFSVLFLKAGDTCNDGNKHHSR